MYRLGTPIQLVIIYLQLRLHSRFISRYEAPLPKFGLPARGVYLVPLLRFPVILRLCGTFKLVTHGRNFSAFAAVTKKVPWLIGPSTDTTSISARAGVDFPQPR